MSKPVLFLRRRSESPKQEFERIVSTALLREAEERFERGDRLIDGHWLEKAAVPQARARRRQAAWRNLAESLLLWAGVGALGLAFVGLTLLLV